MRIKFYLDENIPIAVAAALQNRGVDALTAHEAGMLGSDDAAQLRFATVQSRVLVTFNKRDFVRLHGETLQRGERHSGIIVTDELPIGTLLRRLMNLWVRESALSMRNRLEFLSRWR